MRVLLFLALAFWCAAAHASFKLLDGKACAGVPFRLVDNRVVYDVFVDGRGPYHFIFDTGASSVLDAALARDLGLALSNDGHTEGAGAATQETWRTRLKDVSFSGLRAENVEFRALDLSAIRKAIGFERLDGLMGREVLSEFLVRYDFDNSTLTICDPGKAPMAMRSGRPLHFHWTDWEIPIVDATINGVSGRFIVDTGDRSSLTLFGPFSARNKLRTALKPTVQTVTGQGVGGPIPADVGKAQLLQFGGYSIPGVTTRMPTLTSGGFATDVLAGSIGNGVMRRFNVTFDYAAKTMFLQPNATFGNVDRYDRSGMWLTGEQNDGFTVGAIVAGGPADRSGIAVGDLIVAIDGEAAAGASLIQLRDRLMDLGPGTLVTFTVRGKTGAFREAPVRLADQI